MKYFYWFWKGFYSKEQIKQFNKIINTKKIDAADIPAEGVTKTANVEFVKYKDLREKLKPLFEKIMATNQANFGYDLFDPKDEEVLHYNVYDAKQKGEYDWHVDEALESYIDFKFTLLINLSESSYEGGDFALQRSQDPTIVEQFSEPGDVLLFKSHTMHKVYPVTKGKRISLAYFIRGPHFK